MSEQIKNTLFPFATLRTPELVTEKEKAGYHIHRLHSSKNKSNKNC